MKTRQTTKSEVLKLNAKTTTNGQVGTLKLSLVKDENGSQTQWGWKGYFVLNADLEPIARVAWAKQGRGLIRLIDNQTHSEWGAMWEEVKTGAIRIIDSSLLTADMVETIEAYSNSTVRVLTAERPAGRVRKVKRW